VLLEIRPLFARHLPELREYEDASVIEVPEYLVQEPAQRHGTRVVSRDQHDGEVNLRGDLFRDLLVPGVGRVEPGGIDHDYPRPEDSSGKPDVDPVEGLGRLRRAHDLS
jgi:hypothetical protein